MNGVDARRFDHTPNSVWSLSIHHPCCAVKRDAVPNRINSIDAQENSAIIQGAGVNDDFRTSRCRANSCDRAAHDRAISVKKIGNKSIANHRRRTEDHIDLDGVL